MAPKVSSSEKPTKVEAKGLTMPPCPLRTTPTPRHGSGSLLPLCRTQLRPSPTKLIQKAMIRGVRRGVKMGQTLRETGCLAGEMTAGPDKQTYSLARRRNRVLWAADWHSL